MSYNKLFGAIPDKKGTKFRVWAPSMDGVQVNDVSLLLFDNNGKQTKSIAMKSLQQGIWECYERKVKAGQRYNFKIQEKEKLDPWAMEVTATDGYSVVVDSDYKWQCNDFKMPAWNELVIYQLHPRTYPDDDKAGMNQLSSIIEDMWYLKKLGVNAIQLLPTSEFAGFESWGYNPSCIFAIESSYGGPMALKKLVDCAHSNGIAVFLDVVYNHLEPHSTKGLYQFTPWHRNIQFKIHEIRNEENQELATAGIYFYNDERAHTDYTDVGRPDYGREEVRDFLRENALMWLNEYRIDGLRFDSTGNIRYINPDVNGAPYGDIPDGVRLLRSINLKIDESQPWKLTIAEDLKHSPWITQKAIGEWDGGAGFDTQWDDNFFFKIRGALTPVNDEDRNMFAVAEVINDKFNGDAFQRIIYLENHDQVAYKEGRPGRLPDCIQPGNVNNGLFAKKRSSLGATILLTAPGIPMIFQGQEILEWRRFNDKTRLITENNDIIEFNVDWNRFCTQAPCDACPSNFGGNGCNPDIDPNGNYVGIYRLYRDLIRLRLNWYQNTKGLSGQNINVFHCNNNDKLVAFHRWDAGGIGDDTIVVCNFSNKAFPSYTIGFPREGTWYVRFNSDWRGYSNQFGDYQGYHTTADRAVWGDTHGLPFTGNVGIGPYSTLILSQ